MFNVASNLTELFRLDGRFSNTGESEYIQDAHVNKWTYQIAEFFHISPREVETWEYDKYMETLAYIKLRNDASKKPNIAK